MMASLLLIHAHHGDSHLRRTHDNGHCIFHYYHYLHTVRASSANKRQLTILPCNITLIWHHSLKGTLNGETNAEDSPDSPSIWTCSCPIHIKQWLTLVQIMTLCAYWEYLKDEIHFLTIPDFLINRVGVI